MPDEQWRDEIQEAALLLQAVTSGDRSRVVKSLTDYLLGIKETATPEPEAQHSLELDEYYEEGGYSHEYYGEEKGFNDGSYAPKQVPSGDNEEAYLDQDDRFDYENAYAGDESGDYAPAVDDTYYEEPYEPGAYGELQGGHHSKNEVEYDENYHLGQAHGEDDEISYATNPRDQEYVEEYYGDGSGYDPQNYQAWNEAAEDYGYQHDPNIDGAGGEWNERSLEQASNDQVQEVGDEDNYYGYDEIYPQDPNEATQLEDQGEEAAREPPETGPREEIGDEEFYKTGHSYPQVDYPLRNTGEARSSIADVYDPSRRGSNRILAEVISRNEHLSGDDPPKYSAAPEAVVSAQGKSPRTLQGADLGGRDGQVFSQGPGFGSLRTLVRRAPFRRREIAAPRNEAASHDVPRRGRVNPVDEDEVSDWEDASCGGEEDYMLSPVSPAHLGLRFNALSPLCEILEPKRRSLARRKMTLEAPRGPRPIWDIHPDDH